MNASLSVVWRIFKWLVIGFFVLVLISAFIMDVLSPTIPIAFGWCFSIVRFAQRWEWSLSIVWWLIAFIALGVGAHFFARTCCAVRPRWQTTFACLGALWGALLSGMCIGGAAHQISWLASSPEPLFSTHRRGFEQVNAQMIAEHVAIDLLDVSTNASDWEKRWRNFKWEKRSRPEYPFQLFATRLTADSNGKIQEIILWPRNSHDFEEHGGTIITSGPIPIVKQLDYEKLSPLLEARRLQAK